MPKIDFSQTSDYEVIPADEYRAELESHKFIAPEGAKNGQLRLQFCITEGEYKDRRLTAFCTITLNSVWYMKMCLVACGADPSIFVGAIDIEDPDVEALYGAEVKLTVSVSEYNGKEQNKIDKVAAAQYAY